MKTPHLLSSFAWALMAACADDSTTAGSESSHEMATLPETASCDRDCLIERARALLNDTAGAEDARVTQNGTLVAAADSWLNGATDLHIHNAYADADHGQVMLAGTGRDPDGTAAIFGLRVKLERMQARELELLVAHDGEASLFPSSLPIETDSRYADSVPEDSRDSAETMIGLANRYFDGIEASGDPGLPVADDCNRVENGMQTTRNPRFGDLRCNSLEPFVYIPVVEQRRFPIVDEERGVTAAIVVFQIPGGDYELELNGEKVMRSYTPRALYLFEAFKVADGKIQQIEATMRNLDYGAAIDWPTASD